MMIRFSVFVLAAVLFIGGTALGDQRILDKRGRTVGSMKATPTGFQFRDARGAYAGKVVIRGNRVTVYDARGRIK